MKTSRSFLVIAVALFLGYGTGIVGTVVDHHNESTYGASYRQFRNEWLAILALPGFIITQCRSDYDWGVDEAWIFRHDIRCWNAVFWAGIALLVTVPLVLQRFFRQASASRKTTAPVWFDF